MFENEVMSNTENTGEIEVKKRRGRPRKGEERPKKMKRDRNRIPTDFVDDPEYTIEDPERARIIKLRESLERKPEELNSKIIRFDAEKFLTENGLTKPKLRILMKSSSKVKLYFAGKALFVEKK